MSQKECLKIDNIGNKPTCPWCLSTTQLTMGGRKRMTDYFQFGPRCQSPRMCSIWMWSALAQLPALSPKREDKVELYTLMQVHMREVARLHCVSKNGHLFIFAINLCVVDQSWKKFGSIAAKEICNKTHISNWCVVFNCNPSRKHAKYGHCWHKHNEAKSVAKVSDYSVQKWTQSRVKTTR